MPSYNVLQDHKLKKIIQEFDQEMLTFLFDKGSLINSDIIRINFTSKIRKLPVKEMTNILLEKAIYKEAIDQNMEKEFQDSTEKPVCIEYTIDIFNLGFDKISYVMIAIDDNEESDLIYLNENYSEITYENPLKLQLSYRVNIDDVNASVYLIG